MATLLVEGLGAKAGTTASKFQAYAAIRYSDTDATKGRYLQIRRYLLFSPGEGYGGADGFGGSTFWRNWGSDFAVSGNGTGDGSTKIYGDSGWVNYGWVAAGKSHSLTASCGYASSSAGEQSSSKTVSVTISLDAPNAPSGCTNTRNDDNQNTISWTRGSNADDTYASIKVERSIDAGSWSEIASVSGTSTSYADTSTSANHSYRYRVRAYNGTTYSSYATSGYTYNTPAAPMKVTAGRSSETVVAIAIENPAVTATALELQRSSDASAWTTVSTLSGTVTDATDEPGGGTFYYRARNTRSSLVSDWSPASDAVVTVCAPAAPTLIAPASGKVIAKSDGTIAFEWTHNPLDGSAQEKAQVRYSTNGGSSYSTATISGSSGRYSRSNGFAVNSTVTWSVRTLGASGEYGPWADNRVFYVRQAPQVSFAQPGDIVDSMPIPIELTYSDNGWSLANATLEVISNGSVVHSIDMETALEHSIGTEEWLPENGGSYTLKATVRSSSTLQSSVSRVVSVDFTPPKDGTLIATPDPETGYVALSFGVSNQSLEVSGTAIHVEDAEEGMALVDYGISGAYLKGSGIETVTELSITFGGSTVREYSVDLRGNEMAALPNGACDELRIDGDGNLTLVKRVGKIVLDGTEGWSLYSSYYYMYRCAGLVENLAQTVSSSTSKVALSSKYSFGSPSITTDHLLRMYSSDGTVDLQDKSYTTLAAFKAALAEDPVTIYYLLAEEEVIDLGSINLPDLPTPEFYLWTTSNLTDSDVDLMQTLVYGDPREDIASFSVFRVTDEGRVCLASNLAPGGGLVDKYAPSNVEFAYELVAYAESGAYSRIECECTVVTPWFFLYFEDDMARARWDPEGAISLARPSKQRVWYAGRRHPVSYDSIHVSDERTLGALLMEPSEAAAFRRLVFSGGRAVYKSGDGDVMHVDVEVSLAPAYASQAYYGTVTVGLVRIDGEAL